MIVGLFRSVFDGWRGLFLDIRKVKVRQNKATEAFAYRASFVYVVDVFDITICFADVWDIHSSDSSLPRSFDTWVIIEDHKSYNGLANQLSSL